MRTQSVILNLIPSGVNPVVHLSQYDQEDDGALLFNIYDGNVLADLTGCTATIEGTKPDGTFFMYPCTVYGTYLTSAVNFQMTSIAGNYPAEVRINRGAENVGTINLTMMVEPAGVGRVDVSDTEIPSLLDDIETSVDEAEYWAHVAEHAVTGVASWNGRTGAVNPAAGDYNASQVDYDNTNSGLTAITEQGAIDELTPKKIITTNDAFDPTKTYSAGEWFIHQGVLYEVITACTGVTPPNATYYKVKTLHDLQSEIVSLNSDLASVKKGWKNLALVDLSSTPIDYVVSSNYKEFLISAGGKNSNQIYGGMSVIIPAEDSGNVYFIPCYTGTTFAGIISVYYRLIPAGQPNAGSYSILAYTTSWSASITPAMKVYAKPQ